MKLLRRGCVVTHHACPPGDDGVELSIRNFDCSHQFIGPAAKIKRQAHLPIQDLQGEELGLVSGLVVVVVHQQGVALESGKPDVDVIAVGVQTWKLHVRELLEAIAIQLAVLSKHACSKEMNITEPSITYLSLFLHISLGI